MIDFHAIVTGSPVHAAVRVGRDGDVTFDPHGPTPVTLQPDEFADLPDTGWDIEEYRVSVAPSSLADIKKVSLWAADPACGHTLIEHLRRAYKHRVDDGSPHDDEIALDPDGDIIGRITHRLSYAAGLGWCTGCGLGIDDEFNAWEESSGDLFCPACHRARHAGE